MATENSEPQVPEGVNLSKISDATIEALGLDSNRINRLKEFELSQKLKQKGHDFYRFINKEAREDFKLEIGGGKFNIRAGTTNARIPQEVMRQFRDFAPMGQTNSQEKEIKLYFSGYLDAAFEANDWETVLTTSDSIGNSIGALNRLKEIARANFDEGLRIAMAYENHVTTTRQTENLRPTPTRTIEPTQPPTPTTDITATPKPTPTETQIPAFIPPLRPAPIAPETE